MSLINRKFTSNQNFAEDVETINRIPIVAQLLDVICRTTGMGFSAIARVTEDRWITCTTHDTISFGLKPGDELPIKTTICHQIEQNLQPVFIDHIKEDEIFANHPSSLQYGFQSYISVPIFKRDGSLFGTLCAIDPKPTKVKTPEVMGLFKLFAELISFHLSALEDMDSSLAGLKEEKENAEVREQFIAILGHDLRNPIATTRMSAEILLKVSDNDMVKRQAKLIKSTSFRMETLIENVLDFARGRFGSGINIDTKNNKKSLNETLTQIISETRIIYPNREIVVDLNATEPGTYDSSRIGQMFSNLLGNAATHGDKSPIKVTTTCKDGQFELCVINGGKKIPESALKNLFQPFYRNELKPGKEGLGLGLYIASEIAKAHGGNLEVYSTNEETCFTFSMTL